MSAEKTIALKGGKESSARRGFYYLQKGCFGGKLELFYLDPPYLDTAGYGAAFPFEQCEGMAERLRTLKGRAIVSLNDHPEIRRVFDGFHIETVQMQYTVGLEAASRHEVIISSWDVGAEPAGLF